jgi:hypothetical protein
MMIDDDDDDDDDDGRCPFSRAYLGKLRLSSTVMYAWIEYTCTCRKQYYIYMYRK